MRWRGGCGSRAEGLELRKILMKYRSCFHPVNDHHIVNINWSVTQHWQNSLGRQRWASFCKRQGNKQARASWNYKLGAECRAEKCRLIWTNVISLYHHISFLYASPIIAFTLSLAHLTMLLPTSIHILEILKPKNSFHFMFILCKTIIFLYMVQMYPILRVNNWFHAFCQILLQKRWRGVWKVRAVCSAEKKKFKIAFFQEQPFMEQIFSKYLLSSLSQNG